MGSVVFVVFIDNVISYLPVNVIVVKVIVDIIGVIVIVKVSIIGFVAKFIIRHLAVDAILIRYQEKEEAVQASDPRTSQSYSILPCADHF